MSTEDFDYYLPDNLVAQVPLVDRDHSKMMVVDKDTGEICHKHFFDIIDYLEDGDTLVLNDTKVLPARIFGVKEETGAAIELLLLKNFCDDDWECLVKPARRIKVGTVVKFSDKLEAVCIKELDNGIRHFTFKYSGIFLEILEELGTMPLPPYIYEQLDDQSRYQTVYAKEVGSAAAPTAGLHFTNDLISKIKSKGINVCYVTLHVGLGTFRPVSVLNVEDHQMHSEYYSMSEEVSCLLNKTKESGKNIISVGTTSTRVLETIMSKHSKFICDSGFTDIFIYPGYKFKGVDKLITNFHLPKSTLVMLVSAFSSKEIILNAYKEAVDLEYRFFSFGDCMFIK